MTPLGWEEGGVKKGDTPETGPLCYISFALKLTFLPISASVTFERRRNLNSSQWVQCCKTFWGKEISKI